MKRPEPGRGADHLARLLAELTEPGAYPHPVTGLRVAQTHISCVFLTGPFAYKVKKPVRFEFLDYSSLERRLHFARQEVRLNRRLSPEIYLDVVPVTEQDGRFRIGGDGEPVEWAVRLRQLRETDMLPARLDAGSVSANDLERMARTLAEFHARAAAGPAIAAFGSPEAIARNLRQALPDPASDDAAALPPGHRAAIESVLWSSWSRHEELFRRRMATGRIRDGHGDLRIQNICLDPSYQDGLQIFDCIEFNEQFRYLDVASDLAYLAMDLDLAGRADLREVLLRTYQDASGDTELEPALSFYRLFRACIRGKIALLAAVETEIPAPERRVHAALAGAAFDLALAYAEAPARPRLVVMLGFSGSGKSAVARELARRLPAVRLATDSVRKELAGVDAATRLGPKWYAPERTAEVYREMHRRAGAHLARGEHVVLDGTYLTPVARDAAQELAREHGAAPVLVECRCPDGIIRGRLRARQEEGRDPSDAGIAVYEAQRRQYQTPDPAGWSVRAVETTRPAGELARELLGAFP